MSYLYATRSRRRGLSGLGQDYPTSAVPNPPNLTAGPNPQLVQYPTSSNPLAFVSPQSAIAAGLDPSTVSAAWIKQVNGYSSVTEAVNAGIAPGVVTEMWQGGAPPAPPWWKRNLPVLIAGGGAVLLALFNTKEAR